MASVQDVPGGTSPVPTTRGLLLLRISMIASTLLLLFALFVWGDEGPHTLVLPLYVLATIGLIRPPGRLLLGLIRFLVGFTLAAAAVLVFFVGVELEPLVLLTVASFIAMQLLVVGSSYRIPAGPSRVRSSQVHARRTRPRTRWGVILGVLVGFLLIFAAMTVPGMLRSRVAANEASALGSIRMLADCVRTLAEEQLRADSTLRPADMGPGGARCIDQALVDATATNHEEAKDSKSGYKFTIDRQDAADGGQAGFVITARPVSWGRSGTRSFYMDEAGEVHYTEENRRATKDDPLLR